MRAILDRVKTLEGLQSDVDLAQPLGTNPRNIAAWKDRQTIPWKYLLAYGRRRGISLEWLVNEQGPRFSRDMAVEPGAVYRVTTNQDGVYRIAAQVYAALRDEGLSLSDDKFSAVVRHLHREALASGIDDPNPQKVADVVRLAAGEL